jgi:hypothetical protein
VRARQGSRMQSCWTRAARRHKRPTKFRCSKALLLHRSGSAISTSVPATGRGGEQKCVESAHKEVGACTRFGLWPRGP